MRLIILFFLCTFLTSCTPNSSSQSDDAKALADRSKNNKTITIGLAGDTMLGRLVNDVIAQKGYSYLWGNTLPILKENDFNIVNLETTLTKSIQAVPKVFNFKSDPQNVRALINAHIDIVSLANNHSKDFGNEGLLETISVLDNAGIKHVGAGKNIETARKPVIVSKNDITIGIIGATDNEPTWQAGPDTPGTNYFSPDNIDSLLYDITALKKQVDIVIVSLHWGPNMKEQPSALFKKIAHEMIDAGADIIHGHSAHIFQGIEIPENNKLILYDTGDFLDDYAVDNILRNDRSFLFIIEIDKNGPKRLNLIPIQISYMQVNIAKGNDREESFERMKKLSAELGTTIPAKKEWITIIKKEGN